MWADARRGVALLALAIAAGPSVVTAHSGKAAPQYLFKASYIKFPPQSIGGSADMITDSGTVLGNAQYPGPGGYGTFHYVAFTYARGRVRSLGVPNGLCGSVGGWLTDTGGSPQTQATAEDALPVPSRGVEKRDSLDGAAGPVRTGPARLYGGCRPGWRGSGWRLVQARPG